MAIHLEGLQILQCTRSLHFYILLLKQTKLPSIFHLHYIQTYLRQKIIAFWYIMLTLSIEHNIRSLTNNLGQPHSPLKLKIVGTSLAWMLKECISLFTWICVDCNEISLRWTFMISSNGWTSIKLKGFLLSKRSLRWEIPYLEDNFLNHPFHNITKCIIFPHTWTCLSVVYYTGH